MPKILIRNWNLAIILLPAAFDAISRKKQIFISFTLNAVCSLFIFTSENDQVLKVCLVLLILTYLIYIIETIKRAYRSSAFSAIAKGISEIRQKIEKEKIFDKFLANVAEADEKKVNQNKNDDNNLTYIYIVHSCSSFISEKVSIIADSGKIEIYIIVSWIVSLVYTWIIFSIEYLCVYKIDNDAFFTPQIDHKWGFSSFMAVSFGRLMPSSISPITTMSYTATALSYFQVICAFLLLVVLLRMMFTTMRENYKKDLQKLIEELDIIELIIQDKCESLFNMALTEVEKKLLRNRSEVVSSVRKIRGLPELDSRIIDNEVLEDIAKDT